METNCGKCGNKFKWSVIITNLFLSLVKGFIGIMGSCEVLVADALFSFYQSFIAIKSFWLNQSKKKIQHDSSVLLFSGAIVCLMLTAGIMDVCIFSIVRMVKASQGLLMRPSPYALYTAVLSIVAANLLQKYSYCGKAKNFERNEADAESNGPVACGNTEKRRKMENDITENIKLSIIISTIAVIGICFARFKTLYGDPIAAIIAALILAVKVIALIKEYIKKPELSQVVDGEDAGRSSVQKSI